MVLGEGSAYIHHNLLKNIFHTIPGTNDVEGIYSKCLKTEIAFNVLEDVGDTEASICVKGAQESDSVNTYIHDNSINFSPDRDPARKTAGIRTVNTKNLEIKNNIINGAQDPNGAINIKSDLTDNKIENMIITENKITACLGIGIRISGAAYKNVSINKNIIYLSDTSSVKGSSYGIQFQILKSLQAIQPADFIITNNIIKTSRPKTVGIFIAQQNKNRSKRNVGSPNNTFINYDTFNFSENPKIYDNEITVPEKKLIVDPRLVKMSLKDIAQ